MNNNLMMRQAAQCVLGMEGIWPVALRFTVCRPLYSDHTVDAFFTLYQNRFHYFETRNGVTFSVVTCGQQGEVEEPKNAAL